MSLNLVRALMVINEKSPPLNKPMPGDVKKFKVFVRDPATGNIVKVNFGDPNMTIKNISLPVVETSEQDITAIIPVQRPRLDTGVVRNGNSFQGVKTMSLNLVRALLILNAAKKGWSEAARKKAALKRKAKKMGGKTNPTGSKKMDKILSSQASRKKDFDSEVGARPDPAKFKSFDQLLAAEKEWKSKYKTFFSK